MTDTFITRRSDLILLFFISIFITRYSTLYSKEGMWLPNDIPDPVFQEMQSKGFVFSKNELFNEQGNGIVQAVVQLGGGTGSFVSPDGLILTNHHVAYPALQRISTPENNYIQLGYLAASRPDELPAHGYNAYIPLRMQDVTDRVLLHVTDRLTSLQRYKLIEKNIKYITAETEENGEVYASIKKTFEGLKYILTVYKKIKDIRIVYAPCLDIGKYGGDIDNWMWPRHTGDFTFFRAYVSPDGKTAEYSPDNIPFKPETFLKINPDGVQDSSFTFIAGYPYKTMRFITSFNIAAQQFFHLPYRIRLYSEWLQILNSAGSTDPEASILNASMISRLNNSMKYYQGILDGFNKFELLEQKQKLENDFQIFLEKNPNQKKKFGHVIDKIASIYKDQSKTREKDAILYRLGKYGLIGQATMIYTWSLEKQKPDMDRDPYYMDRNIPELKRHIYTAQKELHIQTEQRVQLMFLKKALRLPKNQRIKALYSCCKDTSVTGRTSFIEKLYSKTRLTDLDYRLSLFEMDHKTLMQQKDPLIEHAAHLYAERQAMEERKKTTQGALMAIMPEWIRALQIWDTGLIYPDANGTLRINFGKVKGYSPKDGVWYHPFTSLTGIIEKYTGMYPFNVTENLITACRDKTHQNFPYQLKGTIPVNFLSTNDSTGGNSGSPVMNEKGELVGLLFDGNYESMSADYEFDESITRSIHVDIRYILYITKIIDRADHLIAELGLM